jgi:RHS repeat-associated protein
MEKLTQITYPDGSLEVTEYNTYANWNNIPTDPDDLKDWIEARQAEEDPIGAQGLVYRKSNRYYPQGVQSPFVAEDPIWMYYTYDAMNRITKEETKTDDDVLLATTTNTYYSNTQQLAEVATDSSLTVYIYNGPLLAKTARLASGDPAGDPGDGADRLDTGVWQVSENKYEYQDTNRNPLVKTRRIWYMDTYYVRTDGTPDTLKSRTEYAYTPESKISMYNFYPYITSAGDTLSKAEYSYDYNGNIETEKLYKDTSNYYTTLYEYDEMNRMNKVTHPDSNYYRFWYDAEGNKTQARNEEGHDFYWTYDNDGRLSTHTADVYGNNDVDQVWTYTDDTTYKRYVTTMTNETRDPDSVDKQYEGCCGRIYKVEQTADGDPNYLLTTTTYFTGTGQLRYAKEPSNKVTKRYYDGLGRLTELRTYTDDETSYIANETDAYPWAAGFSQTVGYKVTRTDAADRDWVSVYDGLGRLVSATDPATEDTTYAYDAIPTGDGLAPDYTYVNSVTDRMDRVDKTYRDMAGRTVRKVEDSANLKSVTDYVYDFRGLLTTLTAYTGFSGGEPTGDQTTDYVYDSRSRLTSETLDDGHVKNYWYYSDSALMATREQRSTNVWIGIVYTRDELNRVVNRYYYSLGAGNTEPGTWSSPAATDTFDYEDIYDRVTAYGGLYDTYVQTKRNDLGQILYEKQEWSDNVLREIDYSYYQGDSKGGELKYVYYPSGGGNRVQWQYDTYHRPENLYRRIDNNEIRVGQWAWNDDGTPYRFRQNGNTLETHKYYDTVGRLSQTTTYVDNVRSFDARYEYDKEGNRLTQRIDQETNWDELYTYDSLYRLSEMKRGNVWNNNGTWTCSSVQRTEDWGLDLLGNWGTYGVSGDESISQTRYHNDVNEITDINQTELSYDLQGNLTNDGSQKYVWDVVGRLRQVNTSGDVPMAYFEYDAYGRRTYKGTLDGVFRYYYDGWRTIEEYEYGEGLSARNVWGLYLDELVVRTDLTVPQDLYPVTNPIYSPLRYYDGSGNLLVRTKYTPYGKPTLLDTSGNSVTPTEFNFPILFTGQRYDMLTGLSYYKNRYHSPLLGRFLSTDAISATNSYQYCLDDPINRADSLGWIDLTVGGVEITEGMCCKSMKWALLRLAQQEALALLQLEYYIKYASNGGNVPDLAFWSHQTVTELTESVLKAWADDPTEYRRLSEAANDVGNYFGEIIFANYTVITEKGYEPITGTVNVGMKRPEDVAAHPSAYFEYFGSLVHESTHKEQWAALYNEYGWHPGDPTLISPPGGIIPQDYIDLGVTYIPDFSTPLGYTKVVNEQANLVHAVRREYIAHKREAGVWRKFLNICDVLGVGPNNPERAKRCACLEGEGP